MRGVLRSRAVTATALCLLALAPVLDHARAVQNTEDPQGPIPVAAGIELEADEALNRHGGREGRKCLSMFDNKAKGKKTELLSDAVPAAGWFEGSIQDLGLDIELSQWPVPLTYFVPTTDAFVTAMSTFMRNRGIPKSETAAYLNRNVEPFRKLVLYHIVNGTLADSDLKDGMVLKTLDGNATLLIDREPTGLAGERDRQQIKQGDVEVARGRSRGAGHTEGTVSVVAQAGYSDGEVVASDVPICEGMVHLIDEILLPPGWLETLDVLEGCKTPLCETPAGPSTDDVKGGGSDAASPEAGRRKMLRHPRRLAAGKGPGRVDLVDAM